MEKSRGYRFGRKEKPANDTELKWRDSQMKCARSSQSGARGLITDSVVSEGVMVPWKE